MFMIFFIFQHSLWFFIVFHHFLIIFYYIFHDFHYILWFVGVSWQICLDSITKTKNFVGKCMFLLWKLLFVKGPHKNTNFGQGLRPWTPLALYKQVKKLYPTKVLNPIYPVTRQPKMCNIFANIRIFSTIYGTFDTQIIKKAKEIHTFLVLCCLFAIFSFFLFFYVSFYYFLYFCFIFF